MKLILEFTEFNAMRLGGDSVPQSTHVDNPQLSLGAYNRFSHNVKNAMSKLNDLYKKISMTSTGMHLKKQKPLELTDISNIVIQRIFPVNDIYYNIYFTFELEEKEYFGVIRNINSEDPILTSEVFKDYNIFGSKEWAIRVKGNLIKVIKKWLTPPKANFISLKEIDAYDKLTGEKILLEEGSIVKVLSSNDSIITIEHEDRVYTLRNENYYYFNYYFKEVEK